MTQLSIIFSIIACTQRGAAADVLIMLRRQYIVIIYMRPNIYVRIMPQVLGEGGAEERREYGTVNYRRTWSAPQGRWPGLGNPIIVIG